MTYAGVELEIPKKEPATLRWDFDEIAALESEGQYVGGLLRKLASDLVGEDAMIEVRKAIKGGKAGNGNHVLELVSLILAEYGTDTGE